MTLTTMSYYTYHYEKRNKKTKEEERKTDPHDNRTTDRHSANKKGTRLE